MHMGSNMEGYRLSLQSDSFHSALRLVIMDGVSLLVAPLLDAKQSQG